MALAISQAELVHRARIILLTGVKTRGRKHGFIWCIREVLRFETKAIVFLIKRAALPVYSVKIISGVKLKSWFCGKNIHCPSRISMHSGRSVT